MFGTRQGNDKLLKAVAENFILEGKERGLPWK
jgi:hypothetical protein